MLPEFEQDEQHGKRGMLRAACCIVAAGRDMVAQVLSAIWPCPPRSCYVMSPTGSCLPSRVTTARPHAARELQQQRPSVRWWQNGMKWCSRYRRADGRRGQARDGMERRYRSRPRLRPRHIRSPLRAAEGHARPLSCRCARSPVARERCRARYRATARRPCCCQRCCAREFAAAQHVIQ